MADTRPTKHPTYRARGSTARPQFDIAGQNSTRHHNQTDRILGRKPDFATERMTRLR